MSENTMAVARPMPMEAGGKVAAIVPRSIDEVYRLASLIAKAGLAPKDMATPEKIMVAIMHGLELGLKPMQAVQGIAVINGRPSIWGDGALGLVQASGLLENMEEVIDGEGDSAVAICRVKRLHFQTLTERRFAVADAKKAGLWNKSGPWLSYPHRMLGMRARSWALRDAFADVLKGTSIVEEVRDFGTATALPSDAPRVTAEAIQGQALEVREEPALRSKEAFWQRESYAIPLTGSTDSDVKRWKERVLKALEAAPRRSAVDKLIRDNLPHMPTDSQSEIESAALQRVEQLS